MRFQAIFRRVLLGTLFIALSSSPVRADLFVVPSPIPNTVYPVGGEYIFGGTFVLSSPVVPQVGISKFTVSGFNGVTIVPNGPNYVETANVIFNAILSIAGLPAVPIAGTGNMNVNLINVAPPSSPGGDPIDRTQITSLDLTGSGGGDTVQITLDPNNPSDGQESSTPAGGGLFNIQSFFDVFTDISINGAPTVPAVAPEVMILSAPDAGATLPLALISVVLLGLVRRRVKFAFEQ